jgi:hypothetical protein
MLNIRDSEGFSDGASEAKDGWEDSSWVRRVVASGASVEM